MHNGVNKIVIHSSRYEGLGYANTNPAGSAIWRVIDLHEGQDSARAVGPIYASKAGLLADLPGYAQTWGY